MWVQLAAAVAIVVPLGLDLYMPVPEQNPVTTEKIELGRQLFHDRRLSRDGSRACASCHRPDRAFSDGRRVATGVGGLTGPRNTPALVNRGYGRRFFWDSRTSSLEETVLRPISNPLEMDLAVDEAAGRVGLTTDQLALALSSYVRSILSGNAPLDRFVNGDRHALSAEEQRGLQVFRGKGNCAVCHTGPNLTDERLHNTGVSWRTGTLADPGAVDGVFKTPPLREIARTAPYMPDGSVRSLNDVIEFYDRGGIPNPHLDDEIRPVKFTTAEKGALVAFLRSLSGELQEGAH